MGLTLVPDVIEKNRETEPDTGFPNSDEAQDALNRVLESPEFHQANRLREFLSYVTSESLAGRGQHITSRTIAQDVYGRGQSAHDSDLSVVRVDAGRLRRRLVEYYSTSGQDDPVAITIPTGAYTPVFARQSVPEPDLTYTDDASNSLVKWGIGVVAVIVVAAVTAVVIVSRDNQRRDGKVDHSALQALDTSAMRRVMLAKSPESLQAANLAEQVRPMMFPAPDPAKMQLLLGMFEHVIDLDDHYHGGHAGASQVLALMAVLSPAGQRRIDLVARAELAAENAVALRPDSSWSQSAAAFVAFAQRDFEKANRLSQTALSLDPDDFSALDFDAIIGLFSGEFARVITSADPDKHANTVSDKFLSRIAYASAQYHLENYQITVEQIESAFAAGEPVSPITICYLVAAHQNLGNHQRAREFLEYYETAWPGAHVDQLLRGLFISERYVAEVIGPFQAAGEADGMD